VGQGFLAEALSDAGALEPQTKLAGDGPPLLVLAGGGGSAHDHQRRAGAHLAPPYMYGKLGMSAEMEGGEQHGWLLNEGPVRGASTRSWPHLWATRRPSSGLRWAGVVIASADRRLGYAGVLVG